MPDPRQSPTSRLPSGAQLLELVRFGLVGGLNSATYFGLYAGGVVLGIPYVIALLIAFVLSACLGYWLHEHWTFGGASPTATAMGKWLGAQGLSVGLNLLLLTIAIHALNANKILAQLVLLPVMPLATYAVGRRWVFTRSDPGRA
jgi:putative flippase GtrA